MKSERLRAKVKICGITNLEDAQAAVKLGADALGFVFYKKSPRYVSPKIVMTIVKELPQGITKVGVFVNARRKAIKEIARLCGLNMLQFHGNETPQFCRRFKNYKVIKAFRVEKSLDLRKIVKYRTSAYLFDTFTRTKFGGTGKSFNWNLIRNLRFLRQPIFLSGGLNARNISQAIKLASPDWVDLSSSLEKAPGKKDHHKMKQFIEAAK